MNREQALKITVDTIKLDSVLLGEPVNLNRVTFWLSELSYGNKWTGDKVWQHTPTNDIVRTAAAIAESHHTARELVEMAVRPLTLTKS